MISADNYIVSFGIEKSMSSLQCGPAILEVFQQPLLCVMDPFDLMEDWTKFSLTTVEDEVSVDVDRGAVDRTGQLLRCCLIGKLLSHWFLSPEVMHKTFKAAWKIERGLQVDSLGQNLFIFHFQKEDEQFQIMKQDPWLFDKFLMVF